jgi:hypothetical protein
MNGNLLTHARVALGFVAAVLMLAGTAAVQADEPAAAKEQAQPAAAAAAAPAKAGETLTVESLGTTLEDMGYEIQRTEGQNVYKVMSPGGNFSWAEVSISGSERFVWFKIYCTYLEKTDKVPEEIYLKMLTANTQDLYSYQMYSWEDGTREIWIAYSMPNHHVTKASLRERINGLCSFARSTESVWNKQTWPQPAAEVAQQK